MKADRKYGVPGKGMCLFLGMWTGNVRLSSVSGPPLNKQASCLGSRYCCLEIVQVNVDRGCKGDIILDNHIYPYTTGSVVDEDVVCLKCA